MSQCSGRLCQSVVSAAWFGAEFGGIEPQASFVWTHGFDWGDFADLKNEPYVKDLSLAKAISPEVLVASGMNRMPLERDPAA